MDIDYTLAGSGILTYKVFFMKKLWVNTGIGKDRKSDVMFHYHQVSSISVHLLSLCYCCHCYCRSYPSSYVDIMTVTVTMLHCWGLIYTESSSVTLDRTSQKYRGFNINSH